MRKEYYSRAGNLCMSVTKPKLVTLDNGERQMLGEKMVEFRPLTEGKWGHYVTEDKEIQDYLDLHIERLKRLGQVSDIITPEEWRKTITPKGTRIAELEAEIEKMRGLSEKNKVAAVVKDQAKHGYGPLARGR